jgi:hypothetical protein
VNKPVDNRRQMRITTRFPWILLWIAKNLKMARRRVLRGACTGSRNVSPFGNGHHLGVTPGTREEPGDRCLAGARLRRAARGVGKARQLASRCGEAGQGPSISYMEGPCLILPGRSAFCRDGTPQPPERQPR